MQLLMSVFYLDLPDDHDNNSSFLPNSNHNSSSNNSLDHQQLHSNVTPQQQQTKNRVLTNILTKIRKERRPSTKAELANKCVRCKELEDQMVTLQDDLQAFENEMYGNKEVIKVLQSQIEQTIAEKETYERLCKSLTIESNSLEDLAQKECELSKCKIKLKQTEDQMTNLKGENEILKDKTIKLKGDIKLLEEMLQIKDQTVISLTNEIFDLEKGDNFLIANKAPASFHSYLSTSSFPSNESYIKPQLPKLDANEKEKLKDSVIAFQAQNQFLNREIIELSQSKRQYEVKMQKLEWAIIEWEAKCCQIQSKLLSLLKEINHFEQENENGEKSATADESEGVKSIAHNETIKALVQRLLDENSLDIPTSWKRDQKAKKVNIVIEYDELGFQNKQAQDSEFDDLFNNNTQPQQLSIEDELEEKQIRQRWDLFISTISNNERLTRTTELKLLLRSGIPQEYRPKVWRLCINMLIEHKKPQSDPNYYANLVKASQRRNAYNPSIKQIELDLLRTLPFNKNFESKECDGIIRLRRVLTAYSQRNPALGYCQGMNRLAAVALLFLSEEDAFWCLVAIIETIMPKDYYTQSLCGAHVVRSV